MVVVAVALGALVGIGVAGLPNLGAGSSSSEPVVIDLERLAPITLPPTTTTTPPPPPPPSTEPAPVDPEPVDPEPVDPEPTEDGNGAGDEPVVRERDAVVVVIANGSGRGGVAGRVAENLAELGYATPATANTGRTATTVVFYAAGFENEAIRLALDLGLDIDRVVDLALAPVLEPAVAAELLVVLGRNWNG